ncbi:hypothetical protein HCK01_04810 [Streptomyces sp. AA8]|uniref:hypothetical protein n=1 Tax=Streptomyces telluris TaxID=2720021 RepID=UPI00143944D1|nr:hypothetical protein [Streptomyces telluris]NJP76649.1 hypothetical protein [Streptomyces telluris]
MNRIIRNAKKQIEDVEGAEELLSGWDEEITEAPRGVLFTYFIACRIRRQARHITRLLRIQQEEAASGDAALTTASRRQQRRARRDERRARRMSGTIKHLTNAAAALIGPEYGMDYWAQWTAELEQIRNPVVRLAHAFSNLWAAVRLRMILRPAPAQEEPGPVRLLAERLARGVDRVAASNMLSGTLAGLLLGGALYGLYSLAGLEPACYAAIPAIYCTNWSVARVRQWWALRRTVAQQE